ncbi:MULTISPECIES: hypothetical protein [unclassified Frankia]
MQRLVEREAVLLDVAGPVHQHRPGRPRGAQQVKHPRRPADVDRLGGNAVDGGTQPRIADTTDAPVGTAGTGGGRQVQGDDVIVDVHARTGDPEGLVRRRAATRAPDRDSLETVGKHPCPGVAQPLGDVRPQVRQLQRGAVNEQQRTDVLELPGIEPGEGEVGPVTRGQWTGVRPLGTGLRDHVEQGHQTLPRPVRGRGARARESGWATSPD